MPQIPLDTTQANIETDTHLKATVERLNEKWASRLRHYENREESDFIAVYDMLQQAAQTIGGEVRSVGSSNGLDFYYIRKGESNILPHRNDTQTILFDGHAGKFVVGTTKEIFEKQKQTIQESASRTSARDRRKNRNAGCER
jgi:hypothetical protein